MQHSGSVNRNRRCLKVVDRFRKGGIYVNSKDKRAPSPLQLARLLSRWKPGLTVETLNRIHDLSEQEVRRTIGRVPRAFMSDTSKKFAFQFIMSSKQELLRSTP